MTPGEAEAIDVTRLMVEVHAALSVAGDVDALMRAIVAALAPFAPASIDLSRVHVDAAGAAEEIEVVRVWEGGSVVADHPMYGRRFSVQASPFGQAIVRAPTQAVYAPEAARDAALAAAMRDVPRPLGAIAVLPLYSKRHAAWQGVIVLQWDQPHHPDEGERSLHQLLLHAVADAMASERSRQRNQALLRELEQALREAERQRHMLWVLFEHLPIGVAVVRGDTGEHELVNPAGRVALGGEPDAAPRGAPRLFRPGASQPLEPAASPWARVLRSGRTEREELELPRSDGTRAVYDAIATPLRDRQDPIPRVVVLLHDLTAVRQAERARAQAQEELVRMQAAALAERSTPLIPVRDDVLVMPLIGAIDRERGLQLLETLSHLGGRRGVRRAILDLTGVRAVDDEAAASLLAAARAVRLRGVQAILTGVQPAVASALVALGVDLGELVVMGSLQDAIGRPGLA